MSGDLVSGTNVLTGLRKPIPGSSGPSDFFNYSNPRRIPTQPTVAQRGPDAAPRPGALVVPEAGGKQIAVRAPAPQGGGLMRAGARLGAAAVQGLGRALPAGGRLAAGAASVGNLLASYGNSDDEQPSAPSQSAAAPASAPDDTSARQRALNRDFSGPKPDGRPDVVYGWAGYGGTGRQLVSVPRDERNGQAHSDARREFYRKHEQDRADAYAGTMQRGQKPSAEGLRAWNKANPFNSDMYERDARAHADAAVAPRAVAFNAPPTALNQAQGRAAGAPVDAFNAMRMPDGSLGYARPEGSAPNTTAPAASMMFANGKVESTPRRSLTPRSDSVRGSSAALDMAVPGAGPMMMGAAIAAGAGHDATRLAATQKASDEEIRQQRRIPAASLAVAKISDGKPAAAPAIPMGIANAPDRFRDAIAGGGARRMDGLTAGMMDRTKDAPAADSDEERRRRSLNNSQLTASTAGR
jgi:hypothetical protein